MPGSSIAINRMGKISRRVMSGEKCRRAAHQRQQGCGSSISTVFSI